MIPSACPGLVPHAQEGPCARLLSNGALTTLLTASGSGVTRFGWRQVTSWTPDPVEDGDGTFLYLRDEEDGVAWSAAAAPIPGAPRRYAVSSEPGLVRFERTEHGIEAQCEVTVAPDAHLELRRLRLRNAGRRVRHLSVTSCLGVVIHHAGGHAGHPAFSKLFVQTRVDAAAGVILARRRLRERGGEPLCLAHALFCDVAGSDASFETDRARFLGRGRSLARPAALAPHARLSGTAGNVLDPIASWRRALRLAPGASAELLCVLAVAPEEDEARALALRAAGAGTFEATSAAAEQRARALLAQHQLDEGQGAYLETLLGRVLHGVPGLGAGADVFRRVRGTPEDLWIFGLPPDQPLVVIEPGPAAGGLARELARAIAFWAGHGISVRGLALGGDTAGAEAIVAPPANFPEHAADSARACARLVLDGAWPALAATAPARRVEIVAAPVTPERDGEERGAASGEAALRFANGTGGFAPDGPEYVIRIPRAPAAGGLPPMPWVNVLANPELGTIVSERGAATTWRGNSREHRLTPWSNDPILDPHGEALWVRDEGARAFWSPQPGPTPGDGAYEVRHGFGVSRWRHVSHELEQEVETLVAPDAPVKLTRLRLVNRGARVRHLSVFSFARLVLAEGVAQATVVEASEAGRVLRATNGLAGPFARGVAIATAWASAPGARIAFSADRRAFLGAGGSPERPRALVQDTLLDGRDGAALDPCFAQQLRFDLPAGAAAECVFALGEADGADAAAALAARTTRPGAFDESLAAVRAHWDATLGAVRVETPSPALDLLLNGWLAYQTLACRLFARSAFYQSGGAFGYRDQLQDAASLVLLRPDVTRAQILLHAAHQFVEGDVLHWWHPPGGRGTRTRFADDLLWLPFVTAHYVATTGDAGVLDEDAGFVTARALAPGEDEAYLPTERAAESASVYTHCCRAIERSLAVGAHGLPLMGTGDWNDGMNRVGREGRGESVWMAFFLHDVLRRFEPLCAARGEGERAARYAAHRAALVRALEEHAWDGAWYRRAWFDDGALLGTASAEECRIDLLPQAWAVLSGAAPRERCEIAMDSALRELFLPEGRLLRLLAPPFDRSPHDPGYIQGYVPGIRENGGQYTHAATWAVRALAELGRREQALALLEALLPVLHARTPEEVSTYQVEPYVVAADVYAVSPHVGRGGWTWYTGSSGWLFRVALESVLGLRLEDGRRIVLRPRVPDAWPGFRITLRLPGAPHATRIDVRNPTGRAERVVCVRLDGVEVAPEDGAAVWHIGGAGGAEAADHALAPREVVVELAQ
jgi:cyclic beta-1,2-glucan synthetase